jgi:hypothetical protein
MLAAVLLILRPPLPLCNLRMHYAVVQSTSERGCLRNALKLLVGWQENNTITRRKRGGKVKVILCLISYVLWHENERGSGGIASKPRPFYSQGNRPPYSLDRGLQVWAFWRTEKSCLAGNRAVHPVSHRHTDWSKWEDNIRMYHLEIWMYIG